MKAYKKLSRVMFLAVTAAMLAAGCSKASEETETGDTKPQTEETAPAATQSETLPETEETEVLPEGQMRSFTTGEIVDTTLGMRRPVAIMINNIEEATPQQAGTSSADVLYEAVVEGNITRLLGIFQDTSKIEKVGSVRSARHDYIEFAQNFDAIFCHYGWSIYAEDRINELGLKTVSQNVGSAYFQDNNYAAPHHIFANGQTLEAGISAIGAQRDHVQGYEGCFAFNLTDKDPEYGTIANTVKIPFQYSQPSLVYDGETKLYNKFQYGKEHVDAANGQQLAFKNIIIQYAHYEDIVGGSGCQEIGLIGEGKALYVTNGKAIDATWKRADWEAQTKYYDADGNPIKMNPGKTYIAVVPEDFEITLSE